MTDPAVAGTDTGDSAGAARQPSRPAAPAASTEWNDVLLPLLRAAQACQGGRLPSSPASCAAMRALADVSAKPLLRIVRQVQRDPHEAEDVLQTIYLKLWVQGPSFDPARGSARQWLCSIAHNAAVDSLRRQSARAGSAGTAGSAGSAAGGRAWQDAAAEGAAESDQLVCPQPGAFELLAMSHQRAAVRQSLRQLPARSRDWLQLAVWGEMTHGQLAMHLGQPLGTVKSVLRRSYAQLRPSLQAHR